MKKPQISLIAAIGAKRELGKNNKLLWHIGEDLKRFKKLTEGHAVIMGRKTFESIGKPLPNRLNIVITRNQNFKIDHYNVSKYCNVVVCHSIKEAIKEVQSPSFVKTTEDKQKSKVRKVLKVKNDEIFIIGGGEIYRQAIKYADKLYLTIVEARLPSLRSGMGGQADTFFPDYNDFKKIVFEESHESGGYKFRFVELTK